MKLITSFSHSKPVFTYNGRIVVQSENHARQQWQHEILKTHILTRPGFYGENGIFGKCFECHRKWSHIIVSLP